MILRKQFFLGRTIRDAIIFWFSIAVVSLFAGFVGGGFRTLYLPQPNETITPQKQTIVLQERNVMNTTRASEIRDVIGSVRQSMVAIYAWKPNKTAQYALSSAPLAAQFVSYALVVTNDGWLVTSGDISKKPATLSAISADARIFSVEQVVTDASAGYTFLKISAKNMKAIEFSSSSDPLATEDGYLISDFETIERVVVSRPRYADRNTAQDAIISSATLRNKLHNPNTPYPLQCMPVVRNERTVLGCTTEKGIRSFRYLQRSLSELLRKGTVQRPTFDIPYIDLSYAPIPLHSIYRNGAIVTLDERTERKKTLLQNGDVILSVNGENIDNNRNFGELITQYSPGDSVILRIARKEREQEITIILN